MMTQLQTVRAIERSPKENKIDFTKIELAN